jgi:hypothetical protein
MSVDGSTFESTPPPTAERADESLIAEPPAGEPVVAAEPTPDVAVPMVTEAPHVAEPTMAEPTMAEPTMAEPAPHVAEPTMAEPTVAEPFAQPIEVEPEPVTAAIDEVAAPSGGSPFEQTPDLPPPPASRPEFDVPPAPPMSVNGLAQRPFTPDTARQGPVPNRPEPGTTPSLPTRTQRGTGPEGPDRLATPGLTPVGDTAPSNEPAALQAALAAFDSGRSGVKPGGATLPTRDRGAETLTSFDEPQAVTQSRVDPSALRDRLRAFQTEFTTGASEHGADTQTDHTDTLGEDPR